MNLYRTLMVSKEFWGSMVAVGFIWYSLPVTAETRENSKYYNPGGNHGH
eukprot:CAMPEP_0182916074 /NCGR_PEP_ID=MMETSP0105_2-20130417/731_1 /TAXON_ID=81532 ORGANISM="Acanthoeca-like sp., Strain 10tr" /NCGR_SAMPLE_ID=MMETSP0105_2 /ASSEMBLY_ACC=CAM_ASM_000205 /LENGTH=48 /DNA_ID= /DNA_START= /DNA_END= /DNA_ORIENTATION=